MVEIEVDQVVRIVDANALQSIDAGVPAFEVKAIRLTRDPALLIGIAGKPTAVPAFAARRFASREAFTEEPDLHPPSVPPLHKMFLDKFQALVGGELVAKNKVARDFHVVEQGLVEARNKIQGC